MEHVKQYFCDTVIQGHKEMIIEGPVSDASLMTYKFHSTLSAFRPPLEQFNAIIDISTLAEGRIIIARDDETIVGYITFLHPDPLERWSDGEFPYILELGAVEVAHPYRNQGIASSMLHLAVRDTFIENYIIITTEYYWHWDLKTTGLDVYEYKALMIKFMEQVGFQVFSTNDPEITGHPANTLMARIGERISDTQKLAFDAIRFKNRFLI